MYIPNITSHNGNLYPSADKLQAVAIGALIANIVFVGVSSAAKKAFPPKIFFSSRINAFSAHTNIQATFPTYAAWWTVSLQSITGQNPDFLANSNGVVTKAGSCSPYIATGLTEIVLKLSPAKISETVFGWLANSVYVDQTPRSAASDLGLHCMRRPTFTVNIRIFLFLAILDPSRKHAYMILTSLNPTFV